MTSTEAALSGAAKQLRAAAETHKRSAAAHRRKARESWAALEAVEAEARALGLTIERKDHGGHSE